MNELDVIAIVTARLRGLSWTVIARDYDSTAQKLRRHVKQELFPTRKRR